MPTVLITGASRGIGLEFAKQYADDGWKVIATCRDPGGANELKGLAGKVEVHALDITDRGQIQALAKSLKRENIDILINNAGIYGPKPALLGGINYGAWEEVMRTDAMSPLKVSECFLDHIARGKMKKIIAISSKMGSISDNSSGGSYIYRSSKAALNAVMKSLSIDLKERGVVVALLHPGWVKTDMGGPGALIDSRESVSKMRDVIAGLGPEQSGGFFGFDGERISW
ncbi:MAG: SDR family oxidoreductase [Rhodospirillales bacterium]|nr:SDR family oxidoreductase [Rhodospirillales bacterium]